MNSPVVELPLGQQYDVALFDLDGVVYRGPLPVDYASEGIATARDLGMKTVFVTNNASRTPQEVAQHLTELHVPTQPHEVRTAAQAAAAYIAESVPGAKVLVIGGKGLHVALQAENLTLVASAEDEPDVVVQGFAPHVGWEDLAEGVYAIHQGAKFIATNLDATIPTERGMAPGNGSLVAAVKHATSVEPISTGKPAADIFHQAAAQAQAARPLVIGDRLDTDIKGAQSADMPSLHVLTGVDDALAVIAAPVAYRPTYLADDLRALAEPYHMPQEQTGSTWECEGEYAQVREGQVWLWSEGDQPASLDSLASHTGEVSLNMGQYRSVVHGCWAWLDSGKTLAELPRIRVDRHS